MNNLNYSKIPDNCYRCKFKSNFIADFIEGEKHFCNLRRIVVYETCKLYSSNWIQKLSNWLKI